MVLQRVHPKLRSNALRCLRILIYHGDQLRTRQLRVFLRVKTPQVPHANDRRSQHSLTGWIWTLRGCAHGTSGIHNEVGSGS